MRESALTLGAGVALSVVVLAAGAIAAFQGVESAALYLLLPVILLIIWIVVRQIGLAGPASATARAAAIFGRVLALPILAIMTAGLIHPQLSVGAALLVALAFVAFVLLAAVFLSWAAWIVRDRRRANDFFR